MDGRGVTQISLNKPFTVILGPGEPELHRSWFKLQSVAAEILLREATGAGSEAQQVMRVTDLYLRSTDCRCSFQLENDHITWLDGSGSKGS